MIDVRRWQALWWRERAALFSTPLAWTVAAIFALAAGLVELLVGLSPGVPASVAPAGGALVWCILLLAPALAVRSATEDRRSGYGEVLAAGPCRSEEIALARFAGAMAAISLAIGAGLLGPAMAVGHFARLDWGELFTSAAGLLSIGAALVATGLLVGTVSRSAPVAAFVASIVWLALVVCGQVVPQLVGPSFADAAFALDPMRRIARALGGVLDVGDLLAFFGVVAFLLVATTALLHSQRTGAAAERAGRLRTALALTACLVGALAFGDATGDPRMGPSVPLARGPAAPLTNETSAAIREAPDAILTLVASRTASLPAVEDLLERTAAAGLPSRRFDPDDPDDPAYAAWLDGLAARDADRAEQYDNAIATGLRACATLAGLGAEVPAELATVGGQHAARARTLAAAWTQFSEQWGDLERAVEATRAPSAAQPFGDRTAAAALVRDSLSAWASRTAEASQLLSSAPVQRAQAAAGVTASAAAQLGDAAAALRALPPLRHAAITRALADGSALVVERGESVSARPGWMVAGEGLDARSRAESILLDALRLPSGAAPPVAVIVHAEPRSLLRASSSGADAAALRDALAAARFEVREWATLTGEEPSIPESRARVYWIIPPLTRQGVETSEAERGLLAAAGRLVDRGEPIVLSLSPSLLAVAGQQDPWAALSSRLGVDAGTDRLWLERVPLDEGRVEHRSDMVLQCADLTHPIGPAVDALPVHLPSAVPLRARLEAIDAAVIHALPQGDGVFISRDWRGARHRSGRDDQPVEALDAAILAISDANGPTAVVVGCPDWMVSAVMRQPASGGAERSMLAAPGNLALAVAASMWLAGESPAGFAAGADAERRARVPVLSSAQFVSAAIGLVGVIPIGLALTGWTIDRRRRHA